MIEKDPIYIFLHISKCAGSTFAKHIKNNFNQNETINLYPRQIVNHAPPGLEYLKTSVDIKRYLELLDESKKNKIKIIYGHNAYYGLHEHFDRPCRYITFLRNPVDRMFSFYNMGLALYEVYKNGMANSVQETTLRSRFLDKSSELMPLEEWINSEIVGANHLVKFIIRKTFEDRPSGEMVKSHLEKAKEVLEKFYFVGITEYYDTDAAFLYNKLGIRKFYGKANVAKKYYLSKNDRKALDLIRSKTELDMELYEYAVKLNREFKEGKDFSAVSKCAGTSFSSAIFWQNFKKTWGRLVK